MSLSSVLPNRLRRAVTLLLAMACAAVSLSFAAPAQSAPAVNHDRVVSAVPSNTPAVNDGEVDAIVQVGDTVVVGGTFTSVTGVGESTTTRRYLFAFSASTGKLVSSFAPNLNNSVNELIAGPGNSVYVGGAFTQVGGVNTSHVALLSTTNGAPVAGFKAAATNGVVNSMVQRGSHLYLGGNFTTIGGVAHAGIGSLNPTTGASDGYITSQVSVHHNNSGSGAQGAVGVRDLDVNAAGTRLIAVGNFKRVDNLTRDQIMMLSLGTTAVVTPDWNTNRYSPLCFNFAFDTYVRGVSFSPDGSYLVVTATGGYVANTLCDTAARFETAASGTDLQPTWIDYTGGDTLWANTITEKAVYVGGHQRWLNNSLASDRAGAGSVPRPGLGALNVNTGMPLAWNPGRNPRGAAVYAMYATPTGLWIGSDTEYIGNHRYKRPRIAFFPLASGSPEASDATAGLPGTVYLGADQSPPTATTNDLHTAAVTSAGAGPGSGDIEWRRGLDGGPRFLRGGREALVRQVHREHRDLQLPHVHQRGVRGRGQDRPLQRPHLGQRGQRQQQHVRRQAAGHLHADVDGHRDGVRRRQALLLRTNDTNLYWRWFNADSGIIGSPSSPPTAAGTGPGRSACSRPTASSTS